MDAARLRLFLFTFALVSWFGAWVGRAEAAPSAAPAPSAVIRDGAPPVRLGTALELYVDEAGQATYGDVERLYREGRFHPSHIDTPNLGFTRSALWGHVILDDQRTSDAPLVLEIAHSPLDQFELWADAPGTTGPLVVLGDVRPFRERTYQHRFPNTELPKGRGRRGYFFRATGESSLSVPLIVYSRREYIEHITNDQARQALHVGIMLALMVYNIFLYFGIRERSYLLYSVFVGLYLLFQCIIGGLAFQYAWPTRPLISQNIVSGTVVLGAACAQFFAITFLDLPRTMPRIARAVRRLSWLFLAYLPYAVFGPGPGAYRITGAIGLIFSAVVLLVGILSQRHGGRPARIFLLAWSLFLVGTILTALWINGLVPRNLFTENAQQIGSALEGLLLAIALADRVRTLTRAAEVTQLERVRERERTAHELELLNQELRRQIAERSREIAHLLQEIAPPAASELLPNSIFEDRYRVLRTLGKGATGGVHEVERLSDKSHFALKVLLDVTSPEASARFAREAEIAAGLRHPYLVSVVDFGVTSGRVMYLVMELIDGPTVAAEWKLYGNPDWALPLLAQIALGLRALHARGIVHRDLKPSNVLLGSNERGETIAKIADFGLSRAHNAGFLPQGPPDAGAPTQAVGTAAVAEGTHLAPQTLTQAGVLLGTPQYMPPELAHGVPHVSPSVDVFAFGVMAVEMLAAASPFATPPLYAHLAGRAFEKPKPVSLLCPSLCLGLASLLDRCLDERPEARPSAVEIVDVFSAALTERTQGPRATALARPKSQKA